jgi:hypothetical protein
MQLAPLLLSIVAIIVSSMNSIRQWRLSRHANSLRVLVDLFKEHREDRLARARKFVYIELANYNTDKGLSSLPEEERLLVRDLAWFYDNLGALVVHKIVDLKPVAGYLGGSVINVWERLKPIVDVERELRQVAGMPDPGRWQEYFEMLYRMVSVTPGFTAHARINRPWYLTGWHARKNI